MMTLGNREGGKVTKVHTDTLSALTLGLLLCVRQFWLCLRPLSLQFAASLIITSICVSVC